MANADTALRNDAHGLTITPTGEGLGATVDGIDLAKPMEDGMADFLLRTLCDYGVLCFPKQTLDPVQQKAFSSRFGSLEVNVAGSFQEPGHPEVMILSNIVEDGKPIGLSDAGQGWHTDMSYSATIAFANVLYGIRIPKRDGVPLGATAFANMYAAYVDLPEDIKTKLEGKVAIHDFNKFWEMIRREKGSTRPPLTEEQRRRKPPVPHPIFMTHPVSGRKVLYCNPGYAIRIEGMPEAESDAMLDYLFEHQLQEKYIYRHRWTEGDVLVWDDIATLHNAIDDYGPDEPRLIKRCQVMADKVFAESRY
ncbi:MAG: TauD/TfdA family dioxygenase [Gammaproteobacteria bacterium]|jgi:taurine dioxygenase